MTFLAATIALVLLAQTPLCEASFNAELSCSRLLEGHLSWTNLRERMHAAVRPSTSPCAQTQLLQQKIVVSLPSPQRSPCPIGHLVAAWLRSSPHRLRRQTAGTDEEALIGFHQHVASRTTLADIFWSSWPLFGALAKAFGRDLPERASAKWEEDRQILRPLNRARRGLRLDRPGSAEIGQMIDDITLALHLFERRLGWGQQQSSEGTSPLALLGGGCRHLWAAFASLQTLAIQHVNLDHRHCARPPVGVGGSTSGGPGPGDSEALEGGGTCPACLLRTQTEWVQEAKHLEMIYEFSHQQVLFQDAMQAAQLGHVAIERVEHLVTRAHLTQQRKRSLLHTMASSDANLVEEGATTTPTARREAFATVLWTATGSASEFQAYLEVVLVLALRLRSVSAKPRPFLVLVPEDTPSFLLEKLRRLSGLLRARRVLGLKAFTAGGLPNLPGGVGPVYDWPKLLLWTLTEFQAILYLDADTLPLERGSLEPIFQAIEQGAPFAAAALGKFAEVNNGVFALEPSRSVFDCMDFHAANGTFLGTPEFILRGSTWQAFLDLFWLHFSQRRLWTGEVSPGSSQWTLQCPAVFATQDGGPDADAAAPDSHEILQLRRPHLQLPAIFNFPCSFVGVARKGQESLETVAARWAEDLVPGNIAVLHWVGSFRKPWLHSSPWARSPFDREWWRAHRALCHFLRRRGRPLGGEANAWERWGLAGRRLLPAVWPCQLLCSPAA